MPTFTPISAGGTLKPADIEGHVLVVEPTEYLPEVSTAMGMSEAVRVTVHDLTTQETSSNVLWFSRVLVASLRPMIGQQVLAVMGKGVQKPGQNAPWMLHDASDDEDAVAAANAYLAKAPQPAQPDTVDPKQGLRNALKGLPGSTVVQ